MSLSSRSSSIRFPDTGTVSMPQPMSTPTRLGTTLSPMVRVVPMVQPTPAWTSGMMRILLPAAKDWSQRVWIWPRAPGSSSSQKTRAVL